MFDDFLIWLDNNIRSNDPANVSAAKVRTAFQDVVNTTANNIVMANTGGAIYTLPIEPGSPAISVENTIIPVLTPGTYTNFGGVVLPEGHFGLIFKNAYAYAIETTEMPTAPVDGIIEEGNTQAVSGGEVFEKTVSKTVVNTINSKDYSLLMLDKDGKIGFGIKKDGTIVGKFEANNNYSTGVGKRYDYSDVGLVEYQNVGSDYSHIIMYGQSNAENNYPSLGVTGEMDGNFMAGVQPTTGDNTPTTALNPLKNLLNYGEVPVVPLVHTFSKLYRRFVNKDQKFIGNSCARSSRSIESLSKECTNTAYMSSGVNLYTSRFLNIVNSTKSIVDGLGKTVSCPAILFMQGESNYAGAGQGLTTGTDQTQDKEVYKALLLQLKNNMQADIMSIYGQTKPPLFFIYQTGKSWVIGKELAITMAQIEFAQENEDVILMNPTYQVGDSRPASSHMSSNGSRWYGGLMAKAMYNVFIKGKESPVLIDKEIELIDTNTVRIYYQVPVEPLVLDDWTAEPKTNYGFRVYNNNVLMAIESVKAYGNYVDIKTVNSIQTGNVEVTYAGYLEGGAGNLRDSDEFKPLFKYEDYSTLPGFVPEFYVAKDENDEEIYNKKTPMYNWASLMYKKITVE